MFNFVKKLIIFLAPIGLVFIIPLFIFLSSREYYSPDKAAKMQIGNPTAIYGPAYNNPDRQYKKSLVAAREPAIIALGSSRVMQFRQEFFMEPNRFTNAGGGAYSLSEMNKFIRELPSDSKVELLILNLDPEMFKPDSSPHADDTTQHIIREWLENDWRLSYLDYFSGKFSLQGLFSKSRLTGNIGLNALINNNGFRADGSYQYAKTLLDQNRGKNLTSEFEATLATIKQDRGTFLYGEKISDASLSEINDILQSARERQIYVIGYLPPLPRPFYQSITETDDIYKKNMLALPAKIADIFSRHGFSFYDFSDINILKAGDTEFVDANHGTDKMYLRIAIFMSATDTHLRKYIDPAKLREKLQNTKKDFIDLPTY